MTRPPPAMRSLVIGVVCAAVAAILAMRIRAIFSLNVNWDEFALLQRAILTEESGRIVGGGRPGLATLVLLPFAAECANAVDAIVRARMLWTVMVLASVGAFWLILREIVPESKYRGLAIGLGLSVWAIAPVFLRTSTQVRTDQPAVLFGLLGGLALLASRRHPAWALAAGGLLGIGFLFSQKLVYVAALVGLLAAGQLLLRGDWSARREAARALLAGGAFFLVVLGYRELTMRLAGGAPILPLEGQLRSFEFYREFVGWDEYLRRLPMLVPQLLPLLCLPLLTFAWLRRKGDHGRALALGWAVFMLGVAVAVFHAGRFAYFFIVLGLFPAVIAALLLGPILERSDRFVARAGLVVALWMPLLVSGMIGGMVLSGDTRSHQRAALDFVDRNFEPAARGFDANAEFACRRDPDPFPVRFPIAVEREFMREEGDEAGRALISEFRERAVAFMLLPMERDFYPPEVRDFWDTRYAGYHGDIRVAGKEIEGGPGWTGAFEAVVSGDYLWRASAPGSGPLLVNGREVPPGGTLALEAGPAPYDLALPEGGRGMFVLALEEPPVPSGLPFYIGF